jgi:hypothetical protein
MEVVDYVSHVEVVGAFLDLSHVEVVGVLVVLVAKLAVTLTMPVV